MKNKFVNLVIATSLIASMSSGALNYAFAEGYGEIKVNEEVNEVYDSKYAGSGEYSDIQFDEWINRPLSKDSVENPEPTYIKSEIPPNYKAKYDPRVLDLTTPVKSQENTGICWAFSGLATYESFLLKKGLGSQDLSEEHMRWWAKDGKHNWKVSDLEGATNEAPVGYLTSWAGPKLEKDLPFDSSKLDVNGATRPGNYDSAPMFDYRVTDVINLKDDVNTIKNAVYEYGAVMTGYFESKEYASSDGNSVYVDFPKGQNHSIAIVGWDDNYPASKFTGKARPDSNGAWLVKNSWGPYNSEGGYFWISYEDQTVLSYTDNYAIVKHMKYNGEKIYQHENSFSTTISANRILAANVFDFNEPNERLQAVMFATESGGAKYSIFYIPVVGGKPDYNQRRQLKSGVIPFSGYVTVETDNYNLPNGKGAIGVEVDNSANRKDSNMCIEMNTRGFANFVASANLGESFVYQSGGFKDINSFKKYQPANVVIKAITNHKDAGKSIIGTDRFDTAIKLSNHAWTKAENAVIVNSNAIVDALTSSPYAKALDAPILLTDAKYLTASTSSQLTKLGVKNVTIIGGKDSVSKNAESQIKAKGIKVSRISGVNRYDTSNKIADALKNKTNNVKEVAIVNGYKGLADAISFSTVSAERNIPIILTDRNGVLPTRESVEKTKGMSKTYIIGGTSSVPASTQANLQNVERLFGTNRKDTNAKVIEKFYPQNEYSKVYIVKDGQKNPSHLIDGLAVGPVGGKNKSPLIIGSGGLSEEQKRVLSRKKITDIIQVGGGANSVTKSELIYLMNK